MRQRLRAHRGAAPGAAVLTVMLLVLLGPALVGGRVLTTGDALFFNAPFSSLRPPDLHRPSNALDGDELYTFQPQLLKTRQELSRGEAGLWTGDVGGGRPLLASQQHAPLFPLTWLAFLLPFWSSLAWIAAGRLAISFVGTYLYCRELGHGRAPAALGASAFTFGMYMVTWLAHPHVNVYAMLPWIFLLVRRAVRRGSALTAVGLALAIGLAILGGHPESCAIVLGAGAAYAAFEIAGARGRRRPGAVLLAGGVVGGLCLGALMIVPLAELLGLASRSARNIPPSPVRDVYTFLFPELAGRPDKGFSGGGIVNFQERTAYIGVLPLLLAGGGLAVRRARTELFLVGLAILSLLLVYSTPLAHGVRKLPGVGAVDLVRLLVVVTFAGAVLAASGLETALRGTPAQRRRLLISMAVLGALPALGSVAGLVVIGRSDVLGHAWHSIQQLPAMHPGETDKNTVALGAVWHWAVFALVGVGALWLAWRRGASRALAGGLAVALAAFDLLTMAHGYRPMVKHSWAVPPTPPSLAWADAHAGSQRVSGAESVLAPNLPSRFGLRSPGTHDPPFPARYNDLVDGLLPLGTKQLQLAAPRARQYAALFGVRYVVLPPRYPLPAWLRVAHDDPGARVALNPDAVPRAWVAYSWRPVRRRVDALFGTILETPRQAVDKPVIEGAGPVPAPAAAARPGAASLVLDRDEAVTVRADAARAGFLVLDDSFYPGWQATVDGRRVPILAANHNFRAVALTPGRHEVAFRYRPASALAGAVISGLAALVLLGLALVLLTRRRRTAPANSLTSS